MTHTGNEAKLNFKPRIVKRFTAKTGTMTVDYLGVEGIGRTATEAKAHAQAQIVPMLKGSYDPVIVKVRDYMAMIWREARNGWVWRSLEIGTGLNHIRGCTYTGPGEPFEKVLASVILHACQLGWKPEEGPEPRELMALLDETGQRAFYDWATWQLDYRRLRLEGKSDVEAHREARSGRTVESVGESTPVAAVAGQE